MVSNILINGLIAGSLYALLAVGFALIFSVAGIINIAHTAFYMVGAFLIYIMLDSYNWHILPTIPFVIFLVVLLGILCFRVLFNRVREHMTTVLIMSIAVAMVFQEILLHEFGGTYRSIPPLLRGSIEILGTRTTQQHVLAVIVTFITLIALWLWLSGTRIGNAIRAVSQDKEIANLMGINVPKIYMIVMGVSVGLAGIAAVMMGPIFMINPLMWEHSIVVVLASVVLGGLGSVGGAIIGAFILGFAETLVVFLIPGGSYLGGAVSLIIMVGVLLVRPEGLFGVFFEEERI